MGKQATIDSISLPDAAALAQTTRITEVLREPPLVPRDEEYQSRKRSIDHLQKWSELTATSDKNQAPMMSHSGSTIIQAEQAQREEPEDSLCDEQGLKDADYHNIDDENSATIALSNAVRIRKICVSSACCLQKAPIRPRVSSSPLMRTVVPYTSQRRWDMPVP